MTSTRIQIQSGEITQESVEGVLCLTRALDDGMYQLTIETPKKSRTGRQNRYYWGVVVQILADELGYTKDEMHEIMRFKFLMTHDGKFPRTKSTTELSTIQFNRYIEEIQIWASSEFQISIPDADQFDEYMLL